MGDGCLWTVYRSTRESAGREGLRTYGSLAPKQILLGAYSRRFSPLIQRILAGRRNTRERAQSPGFTREGTVGKSVSMWSISVSWYSSSLRLYDRAPNAERFIREKGWGEKDKYRKGEEESGHDSISPPIY